MENKNQKDNSILSAIEKHLEGQSALHWANFELYINNPAAIGEHGGIVEEAISRLEKATHYDDLLANLKDKYSNN